MISPAKRLDNLEAAFLKTLANQSKVNKNVVRRLTEIDKRLNNIEDRREGKSCIGFIEDGDFLVGM